MRLRPADTLATRIAAGFVLVAFAVIALFAVLSLVLVEDDLNATAGDQQRAAVNAISATLRTAYAEDHNWTTADLGPTIALARAYGIELAMRPTSTGVLSITAKGTGGPGTRFDVVAGGNVVARVSLPESSGQSPAQAGLRHTIATSIVLTAACAVVLALLGAALLGRRLARPLHQLASAAQRIGRGSKTTRVGRLRGPLEVHDLGAAFDAMAADLELEDQLRRSLAAHVAHELRTPLSILQGQTAALGDGLTTWSPDVARSFEEEVARLARLVQDLGDLSAAEAASLTLERVPLRLDHLAVDAGERLRRQFHQRGVDLRIQADPATILGDADRVEQIVTNLLFNAVQYTGAGGHVTLVVTTCDGKARLVVEDDGPGIPEAERERVFERFQRGSTSAGVAGTGVGLSIVGELARAHQGTVELESGVERGSRFVVTFELLAPEPAGPR